jgi:hypothetical protein
MSKVLSRLNALVQLSVGVELLSMENMRAKWVDGSMFDHLIAR